MITRYIANLGRCMMDSLLSSIPSTDILYVYLPLIFFTFSHKSIACNLVLVLTRAGSSYANPNWSKTRSRWCVSTMQKHTSGTTTLHKSLLATQKAKKWLNSASYGCHITYNRQNNYAKTLGIFHINVVSNFGRKHNGSILLLEKDSS